MFVSVCACVCVLKRPSFLGSEDSYLSVVDLEKRPAGRAPLPPPPPPLSRQKVRPEDIFLSLTSPSPPPPLTPHPPPPHPLTMQSGSATVYEKVNHITFVCCFKSSYLHYANMLFYRISTSHLTCSLPAAIIL